MANLCSFFLIQPLFYHVIAQSSQISFSVLIVLRQWFSFDFCLAFWSTHVIVGCDKSNMMGSPVTTVSLFKPVA